MAVVSIAEYVEIAKQIGLGSPASVIAALAVLEGPPEVLADQLRAHHLLGFTQRALRDANAADRLPDLSRALATRRPIQSATPQALLTLFADVHRLLRADGIESLLLKGLYLAQRLYGGIDRRPQFDVDVLVRGRDLRRAVRVLRRAGFVAQDYDLHSRTLLRAGVKVDLHGALRRAPAFRVDEDALWSAAREVTLAATVVPTLGDEHTLLLLVLGAFEDLGQGTANLKQLLDLVLLLRDLEPAHDWRRFFLRRADENLREVTVNVIAVLLDTFALRGELARLERELLPYAGCVRHAGRAEALALIGATRKDPAAMRWFARVYPGSIARYLLWFWAGGFPANLRQIGRPWLAQALAPISDRHGARHAAS
jgi:hypothetical protein